MKDPKDWMAWALTGACALVFAFGGVLWANATAKMSVVEIRQQTIEVDHASLKATLQAMKETLDRIEKRMGR